MLESSFPNRRLSIEEYAEMEYTADTRHEYIDGTVRAMAYTSPNHARIVRNLTVLLSACAEEHDCELFAESRLVWAKDCEHGYYPDIVIICGQMETHTIGKKMVATTNPFIVVEVLSESTAAHDKTEKWRCYKKIPSLKQYVLIDQEVKYIETRYRTDSAAWELQDFELEDDKIRFGDCKISLKDIYNKVELDNHVSDDAPNI